jgi:hypothetical protein
MIRPSRLPKFGFWLIPWLPAAVIFAAVRYRRPATEWVLVEKLRLDAPSIRYSAYDQLEQAYPGIHFFAGVAALAAFAFATGAVILCLALIRARRHAAVTPTI